MTAPAALTLVTVQGKIQAADGTPATGTVCFRVEETLRDPADHVLLAPTTFPAELDEAGAFEIDLPATDDPDITPTGWTYLVTIATDVLRDAWRIEVPADTVGALQFDELAPASDTPAVVTYALASALNAETARALAAEAGIDGGATEQDIDDAITAHDAASDPHGDRAAATSALGTHTAASDPHGDRAVASTALTTHAGASDPHGDRAAASAALSTHTSATTSVHGITSTAALETSTGATTKVTAHTGATDPHADRAYTDTQVATKPSLTSSAASTSAVGDSATAGAATDAAKSDHKHGREAFGTPGSSAVADSVSAGAATTGARSDHRHGREAFGNVTALTSFNTSSANGSASTVAHSDHVHGVPAIGTGDVPDLSATYTTRAREGVASGVATLDSSGLVTAAQANAGQWVPADHGLLGWAFDVSTTLAGSAILTGQVVLIAVKLAKVATISTLTIDLTSGGTSLTNCAAGLYDSTGTLRGSTADQSTSWQSGGVKTMSLGTPYSSAPAGKYWVGLLIGTGSTTPPNVGRASSQTGMPNLNLTAATIRYGVAPGTGLSALPSSFTPSGIGTQNIAWWAGLS